LNGVLNKIKLKFYGLFFFSSILFFLGCSPLKKYEGKNKIYENEVQKLEGLTEYESLSDYILFLGSSSIRRWTKIQEQMLPFESVKRGYGGAHFYDLIFFTERLVAPHQKAKALVCFVANDISGKDKDLRPNEVFRLFKFFTRQVHRLHPELPIHFIEITPTPRRWEVWEQTSKVNRKVEQYAANHPKINYISTQSHFLGSNGRPIPDLFVKDSLHLSDKAYLIWSKIIKDHLNQAQLRIN